MTHVRTLCPRCLESFDADPVDRGEPICPSCIAREQPSEEHTSEDSTSSLNPAHETAPSFSDVDEDCGFWRRQVGEASQWCEGRFWWVRLPLWLYFVYVLGHHLLAVDPYRSIFDAINLGIHELGHVIFRPFGEFIGVSGGTITQCLAPAASLVVFYRQRDYYAISVGICWLATNFWGIALYVGDARALQLPLVAPGMGMMPAGDGPIMHDWNHLLGVTGLLRHDTVIAMLFRVAAVSTMIVGLAFGAWLFLRMAQSRRRPL